MTPITGKTMLTGIIGWPIRHSLSPVMHNAAFQALGLDWRFVPFAVAPERLAEAVAGLNALGVIGFNVTIPHKVAIMPLLDRISPEAELIGAVNVVDSRDGVLTGYNTDGIGLLAALHQEFGFDPAGKRILVLGAGGAARAAAAALGSAQAARIALANRSLAAAYGLAQELGTRLTGTAFSEHGLGALGDPAFLAEFDLIVNTTSVGMAHDSFPGLSLAGLKPGLCVYDMVYAPPVTPLMKEAAACGVPCANGLSMLVAQGEAAFAIWTGRTPPEGCMAQALAALPSPGNP
ncbi:shikimate dehydrogenase (NADP(+)) [Geomonas limicola]|uniref:Shikimate dehydrogenase (NADP(+)) n=1 Tax=Geomonas limicola TaxID=2740186 RepID=A0A6V8N2U5_9BACT|nr:shikimate dehydrogenase [Geomonas limicola]GFO66751.1 shikimate dehydrogenase (NADP(+)) [Geomonas limicola]